MSNEDKEVATTAVVTDINDVVETVEGEFPVAEHPDGMEMQEYIYTNDPANPMIGRLFHFIYDAAFKNKLGVMHALNPETKKVHTLLVGVEQDGEGNIMCLPLAKILTAEEQDMYCAPDGVGGYVGYTPETEPAESE